MTDKSQLDKFKALAKEAECDTDEKKFDEALKKISESKAETLEKSAKPVGPRKP